MKIMQKSIKKSFYPKSFEKQKNRPRINILLFPIVQHTKTEKIPIIHKPQPKEIYSNDNK